MIVRAAALYLPVLAALAAAAVHRPSRRRAGAAFLATAWNLPTLLAVNAIATSEGWWRFGPAPVTVAAVPLELWLGWALLWGAAPILWTTRRTMTSVVTLVALDLAAMPLAEPALDLGREWLLGEAVAVGACLVPGLLLGRWTDRNTRLRARVALQVIAFSGLVLYVVPELAFTAAPSADWTPLLSMPWWKAAVVPAMVVAASIALAAVRQFADRGGTPFPLDPPPRLVTTGPYAYLANPMQLGGTVLLAGWAILLENAAVAGAAAVAAAFSAGWAAWIEDGELRDRFGDAWTDYRSRTPLWRPRSDLVLARLQRRQVVTDPVGRPAESLLEGDLR